MKVKRIYPLIVLSLVFLFNPGINIIDFLPDFIAYTLLVLIIGSFSEGVPYLAECKEALVKLACVTLIKIPAFIVMYSNMKYGSDIVPLFTLSFAVLEFILIYSAIKNFHLAFTYLGERTDCESVRDSFPIGKRKRSTVDALKKTTLGFFLVKLTLNVLPETLLLTSDDFALKRKLMNVYPTVLVLSFLASLLIGILWLRYALKFAKSIRQKGDFKEALNTVSSYYSPDNSRRERNTKRYLSALNLLALSSIFIFDLSFQSSKGYNILPHFIYGLILFFSVINLANNKKHKLILASFALGFSVSAVVNQVLTSRFFDRYQYLDLSYSRLAKADYVPIKIFSVIETVFVLGITVMAAIILIGFIKAHTDTNPADPSYSISNRRAHKHLIKITLTMMALSGVINLFKCINVFLKQKVNIIPSAVNPDGIPAPGIPAFTTGIFLLSIVYVIYSFVTASTLKDEVKLKYEV